MLGTRIVSIYFSDLAVFIFMLDFLIFWMRCTPQCTRALCLVVSLFLCLFVEIVKSRGEVLDDQTSLHVELAPLT